MFQTSDGPGHRHHFGTTLDNLCETLDRPNLAERYPDNDYRRDHARRMADELTEVFVTETTDHRVRLLGDPASPSVRSATYSAHSRRRPT